MRTIFKLNKLPISNKDIHKTVMEMKSLIDTIAEEKGLDDSHDLCLASNHLDNVLNALESQDKTLLSGEF